MTTLDRYLFRRIVSALLKTLASFVGLFIVVDLLTNVRRAIRDHDVPWHVVAEYYVYVAPGVAFQAAPLAMLVAGLLVLGRAAEHNEVTAALAGGVSLRRLMLTPVLLALGFAGLCFGLEQTIGAPAIAQADRMERVYFGRLPANPRPGVSWANLDGGWILHVATYNRISDAGEDAVLHALRDDAVEQIMADRLYWDEAREQWIMEDGRWVVFDADVNVILADRRITQEPAPIRERPRELFIQARPAETQRAGELWDNIRWAGERGIPTTSMEVAFHAKFSQPALSFVMMWLAIPFAIRLQRGGLAISFGTSIATAIVYILMYTLCMGFGHVGQLPPVVAAWLANAVFFAVGLILFLRTPT